MNTDKQNNDKGQVDVNKERIYSLILCNDDHHSFDYVIDALVSICEMDSIQAAQCTFLVHFKGNFLIKKGVRTELLPLQLKLLKLGLIAEIKKE